MSLGITLAEQHFPQWNPSLKDETLYNGFNQMDYYYYYYYHNYYFLVNQPLSPLVLYQKYFHLRCWNKSACSRHHQRHTLWVIIDTVRLFGLVYFRFQLDFVKAILFFHFQSFLLLPLLLLLFLIASHILVFLHIPLHLESMKKTNKAILLQ